MISKYHNFATTEEFILINQLLAAKKDSNINILNSILSEFEKKSHQDAWISNVIQEIKIKCNQ